jgi:hypothetical protein
MTPLALNDGFRVTAGDLQWIVQPCRPRGVIFCQTKARRCMVPDCSIRDRRQKNRQCELAHNLSAASLLLFEVGPDCSTRSGPTCNHEASWFEGLDR